MSLAIAVVDDGARAARVVLAGAGSRAVRLPMTSDVMQSSTSPKSVLRDAIGRDLAQSMDVIDDYAVRLHSAVVLRAIDEARSK